MRPVPISKTRLTACVKAFEAEAVVAGLKSRPELLHHADERGRNWLHLCASIDAHKRGLDPAAAIPLAGALLDCGIDVNAAAFTEGTWRATALWYAVSRGGNIDLARYLLASGSTPEHCLWAAVYREDFDMIALLLDAGADLEAVAEEETPLLHAVKYSRFRGAETLLKAGADPDYRDFRGMTALHYMLKKNSDIRHFRTFAAHGARGDIRDREGRTAAAILVRKRDPAFHAVAEQLASASREYPSAARGYTSRPRAALTAVPNASKSVNISAAQGVQRGSASDRRVVGDGLVPSRADRTEVRTTETGEDKPRPYGAFVPCGRLAKNFAQLYRWESLKNASGNQQ